MAYRSFKEMPAWQVAMDKKLTKLYYDLNMIILSLKS